MVIKVQSPKKSYSKAIGGSRRRKNKLLPVLIVLMGLGLWVGYKELQSYLVQPEAIFVLGGHEERERFAAQLASQHPNLPIWVSSGSPQGYVTRIFSKAGVKRDRLHLDYHAYDTVTNFTTLADRFKAQGIDSVYLVTSSNHMTRARLVGEIIFGSRGIIIKPVEVPCNKPSEPLEKSLRDGIRAVFWLITGKNGENLIFPHS